MTDKQIIRAEVERMMAEVMKFYETECNEGNEEVTGSPMAYTRLQMLLSFIDSMPEEPASDDFEAEWVEYFKYRGSVLTVNIKSLARHFANWQRKQMMKDAVSAEVIGAGSKESCILRAVEFSDGFKYGDKVKIIIIKED